MRRFVFLGLGLVFLFPLIAAAQEITPKAEVFGGYSFFRANIEGGLHPTPGGFFPSRNFNMHGWQGSVTGNLNSWFGLVGDFSGHYDESGNGVDKVDTNIHTVLFGPRFSSHASENWTPFVHVLAGVARGEFDAEGPGNSFDNTKLAFALGGGLDIKLGDNVAVRVVQADYLVTRFGRDDNQHNVRLGAGLVFRWK